MASPLAAPAMIGRSRELVQLVAAVRTPPCLVMVEGEAGVGKTRLVTELRTHPELAGHRVAIGACHPIQEPFPLGPVLEAVRTLGVRPDPR